MNNHCPVCENDSLEIIYGGDQYEWRYECKECDYWTEQSYSPVHFGVGRFGKTYSTNGYFHVIDTLKMLRTISRNWDELETELLCSGFHKL